MYHNSLLNSIWPNNFLALALLSQGSNLQLRGSTYPCSCLSCSKLLSNCHSNLRLLSPKACKAFSIRTHNLVGTFCNLFVKQRKYSYLSLALSPCRHSISWLTQCNYRCISRCICSNRCNPNHSSHTRMFHRLCQQLYTFVWPLGSSIRHRRSSTYRCTLCPKDF